MIFITQSLGENIRDTLGLNLGKNTRKDDTKLYMFLVLQL